MLQLSIVEHCEMGTYTQIRKEKKKVIDIIVYEKKNTLARLVNKQRMKQLFSLCTKMKFNFKI